MLLPKNVNEELGKFGAIANKLYDVREWSQEEKDVFQEEIDVKFFELVAVMRGALGIAPLSVERSSLLKIKEKGAHYFVGEKYFG